jgi:hypothetical protein
MYDGIWDFNCLSAARKPFMKNAAERTGRGRCRNVENFEMVWGWGLSCFVTAFRAGWDQLPIGFGWTFTASLATGSSHNIHGTTANCSSSNGIQGKFVGEGNLLGASTVSHHIISMHLSHNKQTRLETVKLTLPWLTFFVLFC